MKAVLKLIVVVKLVGVMYAKLAAVVMSAVVRYLVLLSLAVAVVELVVVVPQPQEYEVVVDVSIPLVGPEVEQLVGELEQAQWLKQLLLK